MVGRLTRLAVLTCGVLAWAGAPTAIAGPQVPGSQTGTTDAQPEVPHLRHADSTAAALLAEGRRRSATFRQLAYAIQAADVLVFVESLRLLSAPGTTVFVGSTGSTRILRVKIRTPAPMNVLVAVVGHELQHVLEVAGTEDVWCEESLARHYERIGLRMGDTGPGVRRYETTAAIAVEWRILDELQSARLVARRH